MKLSNDIMCIWLYGSWVYVFQNSVRLLFRSCGVDGWLNFIYMRGSLNREVSL